MRPELTATDPDSIHWLLVVFILLIDKEKHVLYAHVIGKSIRIRPTGPAYQTNTVVAQT